MFSGKELKVFECARVFSNGSSGSALTGIIVRILTMHVTGLLVAI